MLPQYWLEVRAILLRNDDRLIVQTKLNMKTLGVDLSCNLGACCSYFANDLCSLL